MRLPGCGRLLVTDGVAPLLRDGRAPALIASVVGAGAALPIVVVLMVATALFTHNRGIGGRKDREPEELTTVRCRPQKQGP